MKVRSAVPLIMVPESTPTHLCRYRISSRKKASSHSVVWIANCNLTGTMATRNCSHLISSPIALLQRCYFRISSLHPYSLTYLAFHWLLSYPTTWFSHPIKKIPCFSSSAFIINCQLVLSRPHWDVYIFSSTPPPRKGRERGCSCCKRHSRPVGKHDLSSAPVLQLVLPSILCT